MRWFASLQGNKRDQNCQVKHSFGLGRCFKTSKTSSKVYVEGNKGGEACSALRCGPSWSNANRTLALPDRYNRNDQPRVLQKPQYHGLMHHKTAGIIFVCEAGVSFC